MHLSQRKEQFSRAYIQAVAAVAGFAHYTPSVDDDSIDMGLAQKGGFGTIRSPRLEMQIKCTGQDVLREDAIHFSLELKNYNDLRAPDVHIPRILVVVLVPEALRGWVDHNEDRMMLHHCGYWMSLRDFPATPNAAEIIVRLPRANRFDVPGLEGIMNRIGQHQMP